jgi:hypothetical protein
MCITDADHRMAGRRGQTEWLAVLGAGPQSAKRWSKVNWPASQVSRFLAVQHRDAEHAYHVQAEYSDHESGSPG